MQPFKCVTCNPIEAYLKQVNRRKKKRKKKEIQSVLSVVFAPEVSEVNEEDYVDIE